MKTRHDLRLIAGLLLVLGCFLSTAAAQEQRFMIEPRDPSPAISPHQALVQDVQAIGGRIYVDVNFPDVNGNLVGAFLDLAAAQDLRQTRPDLIVIQDAPLEPAGGGGAGVAWSPDRIDQRAGLDNIYNPPIFDGCGEYRPWVYVCDTGVMGAHSEFASAGPRLSLAAEYIPPLLLPMRTIPAWQDPWDHGTAVAACAVGELTGAGRCPVNLVSAVCYPDPAMGTGFASFAADVIYWSLNEHQLRGFDDDPFNDASVLIFASATTTGPSALLDIAVQRAFLGGMSVVVAAGNQNADAMTTSPAGAFDPMLGDITLTVAASTIGDTRWANSNYGGRVDLFAPGENVLVATAKGPGVGACNVRSGTSFSVGYAGGAAARILARNPWAPPAAVRQVLTDQTNLTFGPSGPFGGGINGVHKLLYVHPSEVECIPLSYKEWLALNGVLGDAPADGDEDCDGLPNAVEYGMALDPLDWVKPEDRPQLIYDEDSARFRFRRADYLCHSGVVFEAEWSTDLINWTVVPETSIVADEEAPCFVGGSWVFAPIPVGGERVFVRLRVTGL